MFAYRYDGYDTLPGAAPGDYPRTKNDVSMTVSANDEVEALLKIQHNLTREVWKLSSAAEIFGDHALDV